jgi:hypothetical protein
MLIEEFSSHVPKGESRVLEPKKIEFLSRYGFWDFIFLFLVGLDTCLQNLIPRRLEDVCNIEEKIIFHKRVW